MEVGSRIIFIVNSRLRSPDCLLFVQTDLRSYSTKTFQTFASLTFGNTVLEEVICPALSFLPPLPTVVKSMLDSPNLTSPSLYCLLRAPVDLEGRFRPRAALLEALGCCLPTDPRIC